MSKPRPLSVPCWLCIWCESCYMDLPLLIAHVQKEHMLPFLKQIGVDIDKYINEIQAFLDKLVKTSQVAGKAKIHYPMR